MNIVPISAELISHTMLPSKVIEMAARQCYNSRDKINDNSDIELCKRLLNSGHHSVLEFANATFDLIIDRGMLAELTRHRVGMSYAVQSTRYCDYSKDKYNGLSFIKPSGLNEEQYKVWCEHCELSEKNYFLMREKDATPEVARSVLPMCLATPLTVCGNYRAWLHFLKLRLSPKAHPDIRELAKLILLELREICPCIFYLNEQEILKLCI